ncbi:Peroxidase [Mycena sanguinolenta]|uniref:Peroxidase n=1 Tax=Mycena sanguinolenta TaxID=230812 RepID=A0A8H6WXY9_9AGAR|nr:Peroxidase [Mycena sanguinolenta]
MLVRLEAFIVSFIAVANAYIWPSLQLDALEAARFDQQGFNANFLTGFIQPCDTFQFGSDTGRANAADWIRTIGFCLVFPHWGYLFTKAYHDMATHNSTDGTGGLDASIRFAEEQVRAENAGDGFDNTMTLIFLLAIVNRYISIADNIALAALIAIENWGPEIAFRGGRADAAVPNAPSVPESQQDLASHIASFARQGFTQEEMIGLVACGHTFGGVQHDFFPDIVNVLNDTSDTEDVAHFATTFVTFDNNVALEYISGTTQNPLVVGFNNTTNSNKRIFGSNGNATMLSCVFQFVERIPHRCHAGSPIRSTSMPPPAQICSARMLDTVPNNVTLTNVITPLPVKPSNVELILDGNTLQLWGQVRQLLIPLSLWNMTEDPTRTVSMLWDDHIGGTGNATLGFAGLSSFTGGKYSAVWYGFNATSPLSFLSLDAIAGVTSLSFVVDNELEDQDGLGFAPQDGFMFSQMSCLFGDPVVRNGVNPTRVYLEQSITDSVQRVSVSEIDIVPPSEPIAANAAYSLWSINITEATTSYA